MCAPLNSLSVTKGTVVSQFGTKAYATQAPSSGQRAWLAAQASADTLGVESPIALAAYLGIRATHP